MTLRNIADEAGCSTTGVYTYFGGKAGLVEAIFVDGFESFDRAMAPAYEALDLLQAAKNYRRWAIENPTQYLVMFGRAVPDFELNDVTTERAFRSFAALAEVVAQVIEARQVGLHLNDVRGGDVQSGDSDGADVDEVEHDAEAIAYRIYASVHGHVMLELVGMGPPESEDLEELYEAGARVALTGLI